MSTVFHFFIIICGMLLPLYLWAYIVQLTSDKDNARIRFYLGLISGIFSVGATILFSYILNISHFWIFVASFGVLVSIMYVSLRLLTRFSTPVVRLFIQKISLLHIILASILFLMIFLLSKIVFDNVIFSGLIVAFLLPAFFEEISKHITVLGMLGKNFRFSLVDLVSFAFCVSIGFTVVENIMYLYSPNFESTRIFLRSIFVFSAHLLALLVGIVFWWKALSYRLLSIQYSFWIILGFISSGGIHFLYNVFANSGGSWFLFMVLIASYSLFVYLLYVGKKSSH